MTTGQISYVLCYFQFSSSLTCECVLYFHSCQIVVLGGNGFVGSAICKAAVSKGIEVISLSRCEIFSLSNTSLLAIGLPFLRLTCDEESTKDWFRCMFSLFLSDLMSHTENAFWSLINCNRSGSPPISDSWVDQVTWKSGRFISLSYYWTGWTTYEMLCSLTLIAINDIYIIYPNNSYG